MQSMRKVHESLTPPPLLLHSPLSHIVFRSVDASVHLALHLSHPLSFPPSFPQRSTIFTLPLPSFTLSFSLLLQRPICLAHPRLLFNPSTLRSIATLLYLLLAQSLCSLVDRSSLLLSLTVKAELLRIRDTCKDNRKLAIEIANFS